tara:strand:- start:206 stop:358 length:153 start_codon:yes stop_codon:yes gene_type:complete
MENNNINNIIKEADNMLSRKNKLSGILDALLKIRDVNLSTFTLSTNSISL